MERPPLNPKKQGNPAPFSPIRTRLVLAPLFIVGAVFSFWAYRKSFEPTYEVEKGRWVENSDPTALRTMERIQKYSDLDLPKDSSASFRLYAQKGFSDTILFLRVAGSENYIRKIFDGNGFTTEWGEMEEHVRAVWMQDKVDPFLSVMEFLPKRIGRWWKPEEIPDPQYAEKDSEDLLSGWKGIYGAGDNEEMVLYLRIFRE